MANLAKASPAKDLEDDCIVAVEGDDSIAMNAQESRAKERVAKAKAARKEVLPWTKQPSPLPA